MRQTSIPMAYVAEERPQAEQGEIPPRAPWRTNNVSPRRRRGNLQLENPPLGLTSRQTSFSFDCICGAYPVVLREYRLYAVGVDSSHDADDPRLLHQTPEQSISLASRHYRLSRFTSRVLRIAVCDVCSESDINNGAKRRSPEAFACLCEDFRVFVLGLRAHETLFEADVLPHLERRGRQRRALQGFEQEQLSASCGIRAVQKDGGFRVAVFVDHEMFVFAAGNVRPYAQGVKGALRKVPDRPECKKAQEATNVQDKERLDLGEAEVAVLEEDANGDKQIISGLPLLMQAALGRDPLGHMSNLELGLTTSEDPNFAEKYQLLRDAADSRVEYIDIQDFDWSPSGTRLAVVYQDTDVEIFNLSHLEKGGASPERVFQEHSSWLRKVSWSSTENILVTADNAGAMKVYSIAESKSIASFSRTDMMLLGDTSGDVKRTLFSVVDARGVVTDDGGVLFVGYKTGEIHVCHLVRSGMKYDLRRLGSFIGHGDTLAGASTCIETVVEDRTSFNVDGKSLPGVSVLSYGHDYRVLSWRLVESLRFTGIMSAFWSPLERWNPCTILEVHYFVLASAKASSAHISFLLTRDTLGDVSIWERRTSSHVARLAVKGKATCMEIDVPSQRLAGKTSVDLLLDPDESPDSEVAVAIGTDQGTIYRWLVLLTSSSQRGDAVGDGRCYPLACGDLALVVRKTVEVHFSECSTRSVSFCRAAVPNLSHEGVPEGHDLPPRQDVELLPPWGSAVLACDVLGRLQMIEWKDGASVCSMREDDAVFSPWKCIQGTHTSNWIMCSCSPGAVLIWVGGEPKLLKALQLPSECFPALAFDLKSGTTIGSNYDDEPLWIFAVSTLCGRLFWASGSFAATPTPITEKLVEIKDNSRGKKGSQFPCRFSGVRLSKSLRYLVAWDVLNTVVVWSYEEDPGKRDLVASRCSLPGQFVQRYSHRFGNRPDECVVAAWIEHESGPNAMKRDARILHVVTRNGWYFEVDIDVSPYF